MTYPALRTTKEDDNNNFSAFFSFHSSSASKCTRALVVLELRSALGKLFHAAKTFASKTREGNVNYNKCPSSTRIRNVRRTFKHFPTIKVDFLTIRPKVVLAISRTIRMHVCSSAYHKYWCAICFEEANVLDTIKYGVLQQASTQNMVGNCE